MNHTIYQVDAFTDQVFKGNPAAVCPLETWLPDETMQAIAAENNLAETAFYIPQENGFGLRWFTPKLEIDLCGHATLAAAHVLFAHYDYSEDVIHFHTQSGELTVERKGDLYQMDFPSRKPEAIPISDDLVKALKAIPLAVYKSRDIMAVFEQEADVVAISPDFALMEKIDALGIIVTAPGENYDFVSRIFAPRAGVLEDPVTGSAHCSLIPYWAGILKKDVLTAAQLSERTGELFCEQKGERVLMAGKAVTYLKGEIFI